MTLLRLLAGWAARPHLVHGVRPAHCRKPRLGRRYYSWSLQSRFRSSHRVAPRHPGQSCLGRNRRKQHRSPLSQRRLRQHLQLRHSKRPPQNNGLSWVFLSSLPSGRLFVVRTELCGIQEAIHRLRSSFVPGFQIHPLQLVHDSRDHSRRSIAVQLFCDRG